MTAADQMTDSARLPTKEHHRVIVVLRIVMAVCLVPALVYLCLQTDHARLNGMPMGSWPLFGSEATAEPPCPRRDAGANDDKPTRTAPAVATRAKLGRVGGNGRGKASPNRDRQRRGYSLASSEMASNWSSGTLSINFRLLSQSTST
jgi:hypothetical protein